jgi:N,N'-diacetyllegionaminate synthase
MRDIETYFNSSNNTCLIIGEVSQTHDGSLGQAHAFIDAIADSGANAVKFQTHIASAESTLDEPFRIPFSRQDSNRYQYWKRMEFSRVQWQGLANHAFERGIFFLSSPFSEEAVDLLDSIGMPAWKIASGEVANHSLLKKIALTRKPVILSSGLSSLEELDEAVKIMRVAGVPFAVMQTTTQYPTPPEKIGLNLIPLMKNRYKCAVGLSDHSGYIFPGLAAVPLGSNMLEVHVTLSRYMFGPDVCASVTIEDLTQLVQGVRFLERVINNPVDKDYSIQELSDLKRIFGRSLVPARDLVQGTILVPGDLIAKKPGTGIPSNMIAALYGRKIKRNLKADEIFMLDDLEEDSQER